MIRTFKYFAIAAGGTPQPLIGTTLSAALPAPLVPGSQQTATVADSSMFQNGDWVMLDVTTNRERASVAKVVDGTHIVLTGFSLRHASGTYVQLSGPANFVGVQAKDGGGGALFLGNASTMVTSTGVGCIEVLQKVASGAQPNMYNDSRYFGGNPIQIGDYWIDGTTNDTYLPIVGVI